MDERRIDVAFMTNVRDKLGVKPVCVRWSRFIERLHAPFRVSHDQKQSVPVFIPVKFAPMMCWVRQPRPDGSLSGYRISDNIEAVTMAVFDLDYDKASDPASAVKSLFVKLNNTFAPFEWILYPTFSNGPNTPRYRLLLPLSEPIATHEWPRYWQIFGHIFGADRACRDVTRAYFWPTVNKDNPWSVANFFIKHNGDKRWISRADLERLGKQLRVDLPEASAYQDLRNNIVLPETFDFSSLNRHPRAQQLAQIRPLPKDKTRALQAIKRTKLVQDLLLKRLRTDAFGNNAMAVEMATGLMDVYGPQQLTFEIYRDLMMDFLSDLPTGRSANTPEELPAIYQFALQRWATKHHLQSLNQAPDVGRENVSEPKPTMRNML
ncbi:MAG: hypothetical protein D6712_20015 [Chloroflexi bacterium]|nr:MAG: hypothetical protein D6712_20015 [Chloroflexota bacterium]